MPDSAGIYTRTNGVFNGSLVWNQDAAALTPITAAHHDTHDQDLANALNNRVFKDGTTTGVVSLNLTATVNASTGVITIGGINFANTLGGSTSGNVFVGNAGNFTATGTFYTGYGYQALAAVTTGPGSFGPSSFGGNVAFGYQAMQITTTGWGNVSLGFSAGKTITTGSDNVAIGDGAMNGSNVTGTTNVAIGAASMGSSTSGSTNVCVGSSSGTGITSGSNNIGIGPSANPASTGNFNIVIGGHNGNAVADTTASNQLNIQNAIWGTGNSASLANEGTGKIGINNKAPTYTFDVKNGDIGVNTIGNTLRIAEGTNAKMGVATLAAGTVVVSNTSVTANSRIFLTCETPGGTPGFLRVSARTAGTSFTILSSSGTDTSVVGWVIFEPY